MLNLSYFMAGLSIVIALVLIIKLSGGKTKNQLPDELSKNIMDIFSTLGECIASASANKGTGMEDLPNEGYDDRDQSHEK